MNALLLLATTTVRAGALPPLAALELTVATVARVPVLGRTRGRSVTTLLIGSAPGPDGWRQRHSTCRVQIQAASGKPSRVTVPDAFIDALPDRDVAVMAATPGGAYRVDMGLSHVGYDPTATDTLPEDADDPAILDLEGDGHPGGTILLQVPVFGAVELYVVQQAHMVLDGALRPDGSADGGLMFHVFEQRTVAASQGLFALAPEVSVDLAHSGFRMAPVAAGTACADLLAEPPWAAQAASTPR
jgi:hypothetical protein